MAMQDLMFVFQVNNQVNSHLQQRMAHNYLSLYCWSCFTFQRSCYCDHTINVAAKRKTLPVTIEGLMSKIFARYGGRSHRRMRPTYTWNRCVFAYDQFHLNYGMEIGSCKRLDYLVERSKDVLCWLIGKMYRSHEFRGQYYTVSNRLSKTKIPWHHCNWDKLRWKYCSMSVSFRHIFIQPICTMSHPKE